MTNKLVCYTLQKTKPTQRTKLHRELYGYKDISNHGKYSYQRKGLLQKTGSKRITDAVILTPTQQANKLVTLLEKYGAKTYTFTITTQETQ